MKFLTILALISLSPAAFSAPTFLKCTLTDSNNNKISVIEEVLKNFSNSIYVTTKSNAKLKELPYIVGVTKIAGASKYDLTVVSKVSRTAVTTSGSEEVSLILNESDAGGEEVKVECNLIRAIN